MLNLFQKHKKLLSVLLVAVFVVGGVFKFGHIAFSLTAAEYKALPEAEQTLEAYFSLSPDQRAIIDSERNGQDSSSGTIGPISPTDTDAQKRLEWQAAQNKANEDRAAKIAADAKAGKLGKPWVVDTVNSPPETKSNSLQDILGQMLSWVLYYIAVGLGWILMLLMKVMLVIAVFNNFLNVPAVRVGWTITRDICNNFFIIFMMIMAIGVTLKLPGYQWRSMLPKILIFAVLINFSKMFTGILIDFSQVLMLTFATPLATVQGYNLVLAAMGLPGGYNLVVGENASGIDWLDIIAALLFVIIISIVAIVVVAVICVILVYRIIMLWFLVILSPLYFMAKATNISQLGSLSNEWMSNLSKMLVVGPAMMFFLYLSFLTMSGVNNMAKPGAEQTTNILQSTGTGGRANMAISNTNSADYNNTFVNNLGNKQNGLTASTGGTGDISLSAMASPNGVINFLVVVGLLAMSLVMGQKFGGAAGKFAGMAQGKLTSMAKKYSGLNLGLAGAKKAAQMPGIAVKSVAGKVGTGTLGIAGAATRGLGRITGSTGLQKLGEVGGAWRQDVLKARREARGAKAAKFLGKLGLGKEGKKAWGDFTDTDFAKNAKILATGGAAAVAGGLAAGLATVATGGLVAPLLAGIAASYVAGGGRLGEMSLGGWGKRRKARREGTAEEIANRQREIDDVATAGITRDGEIRQIDGRLTNTNNTADKSLQDEKDKAEAEHNKTVADADAQQTAADKAAEKTRDDIINQAFQERADSLNQYQEEYDKKINPLKEQLARIDNADLGDVTNLKTGSGLDKLLIQELVKGGVAARKHRIDQ